VRRLLQEPEHGDAGVRRYKNLAGCNRGIELVRDPEAIPSVLQRDNIAGIEVLPREEFMIALLEARRAGLFERGQWLPNLIAGLIVGVVALPLSMAFAIASGARPEQGIYTAIIAGACVSVFGGSRVQMAGPTGASIRSS